MEKSGYTDMPSIVMFQFSESPKAVGETVTTVLGVYLGIISNSQYVTKVAFPVLQKNGS